MQSRVVSNLLTLSTQPRHYLLRTCRCRPIPGAPHHTQKFLLAARSKKTRHAGGDSPDAAALTPSDPTPVVAIGASAGGLRALETFFRNVQPGSGMAFVLAMHLSQEYVSQLAQILQAFTAMPVSQVNAGVEIQPDHVYVISPGHQLSVRGSMLFVSERDKMPASGVIDHLFQSVAEDRKERAVGIVFSGSGADGMLGLMDIKERGGLVLAQDPDEAEFESMPRSIIATGLVDFVLPVADMPARLLTFRDRTPQLIPSQGPKVWPTDEAKALTDILERLHTHSGHDFAHYKRSSLLRQLARRMLVLRIGGLSEYAHRLHADEGEVNTLFRNMLVGVTRFFRDPHAYEQLEQRVLGEFFADRSDADDANPDSVRAWVVGCSTGEEAYSLGMLLAESRDAAGSDASIQILATDIDEEALSTARRGLYPESVTTVLTPARLDRFFIRRDGAYQVTDELRGMVVFAPHDVTRDAPFARMDLLSCRNLLIYFEADMQKHVLERCAYSLKPGGCLMLGTAERTGRSSTIFASLSTKDGLFRRTEVQRPSTPSSFFPALRTFPRSAVPRVAATGTSSLDAGGETAIKIPSRAETGMIVPNTIGDLEHSNDALILANQEMQSLNEELRSMMEEIEVAKEEMQSLNEELTTVNQELQNKIEEHRRVNGDLHVLIESTQMATLFLDSQLNVLLFTPESTRLFNLLPVDIGRPLADLSHTLTYPDFLADAARAIELDTKIEREVEALNGSWYLMRVMPYETIRGPIGGVVLTFADITAQKKVEQVSEDRFAQTFHAGPMAASIVSREGGHFLDVNEIFEQVTGYTRADLVGQPVTALGLQLGLGGEIALSDTEGDQVSDDLEVEARIRTKTGRIRDLVGSSTAIEFGGRPCVLGLFYDVTERKLLEREILRVSDREQRRIGVDLHDGLGTHLTGVALMARGLARNLRAKRAIKPEEIDEIARLVADGVEQARTLAHGLNPFLLEVRGLAVALEELATNLESRTGIKCSFEDHGSGAMIGSDQSMHLFRITQEAVNNAVRHANARQIQITLDRKDLGNRLVIRDDGTGFDTSVVSTAGMGLSIMRYRAGMIRARLAVASSPGAGTTITCQFRPMP